VFDSVQYAAQSTRGGGLCSRSGGPHQISSSENGDSITSSATSVSGDSLKSLHVDRVDWRCFLWLRGDIKLLFADRDRFGRREKLCWAWLNTTMLLSDSDAASSGDMGSSASPGSNGGAAGGNLRYTVLRKAEMDRAVKDKECKQFPAHFKVELFFRADMSAASAAELDEDMAGEEEAAEEDDAAANGRANGSGGGGGEYLSAGAAQGPAYEMRSDEFRPAGQSTLEVDALLRAAKREEEAEAEAAAAAAEAEEDFDEDNPAGGPKMDDVAEGMEEEDEEFHATTEAGKEHLPRSKPASKRSSASRPGGAPAARLQPALQPWQQGAADEAAQLLHVAAVAEYALKQAAEEEAANTFQPNAVSIGR